MTVSYDKVWRTMNDLELVTSKICSAREIIDAAIDRIQEHQYDKAEMMMSAAYEYLEYYLQEFDDKFKLAWQATVGDLRDGDKFQYTATGEKWTVDEVLQERDYYEGKAPLSCDKDDPSPECKGAWNSFWEENYYPEENQQYTEEELNAMCDKAASDEEKEKCREYNLREAEYYDKRAKLDVEHSEHYYDYTRNDINRGNPFKTQNGVSNKEYLKAKIEANSAWNDGWTQQHYQKIVDKYEGKKTLNYDEAIAAGWEMTDDGFWIPPQNKKKWVLPVSEIGDNYFVTFPQDLLEAANLKEGDEVDWVDNNDGTYIIRKVTKPLGPDEC